MFWLIKALRNRGENESGDGGPEEQAEGFNDHKACLGMDKFVDSNCRDGRLTPKTTVHGPTTLGMKEILDWTERCTAAS